MKFEIRLVEMQQLALIITCNQFERTRDYFAFYNVLHYDILDSYLKKYFKGRNLEIPVNKVSKLEQLSPKEDTTTSSGSTS